MKRLIKLAQKIEDKSLREKVITFLKDPKLSHKDFKKYPRTDIKEAGSMFTVTSPQGGITVKRDVLKHTITLVEACEEIAEIIKRNYNISINKDHLIAAAILHDITKIFEWKKRRDTLEHTGILLDHSMLGVAELYHRGFPEEILHLIASHFGEAGPTPPRNFEALIFHHLDTMISMTEFHLYGAKQQQPVQLVLLDDEALKKLGEKTEEPK